MSISDAPQANTALRQRWFELQGTVLSYYRSQNDVKPRGAIQLVGAGVTQVSSRPSRRT